MTAKNVPIRAESGYMIVFKNNDKCYYKDKECYVLHRTDGPAVEYADGGKVWYVDGKLNRLDGPAVMHASGNTEWHVDGKLHRLDGPAIIRPDGDKAWYVNGKIHREDGPALVWHTGREEYWVNNKRMKLAEGRAYVAAKAIK